MGYSTDYKLRTNPHEDDEIVREAFRTHLDGDYHFCESCKWYDHVEDTERISREFPATIITIEGQGEDADDQWVLHVLNGNSVKFTREKWQPPLPPDTMLATRCTNEATAERERITAAEASERAEYERLRKKFGDK